MKRLIHYRSCNHLLEDVVGHLLNANDDNGSKIKGLLPGQKRKQVDQVVGDAKGKFERSLTQVRNDLTLMDDDDFVEAVCLYLENQSAAHTARTILEGGSPLSESTGGKQMHSKTLIAIAAVAAVVAIVIAFRRRGRARFDGKDYQASEDFLALIRVEEEGGPSAHLAAEVLKDIREPWRFELVTRRSKMTGERWIPLLEALVEGSRPRLKRIAPESGERFDGSRFAADLDVDAESVWLVESPSAIPGYVLRDANETVFLKATVRVCTADWWVLTHVPGRMSEAILEDPDAFVGMSPEYARRWTAPIGFQLMANVRERFEESDVHEWAARLKDELDRYYDARDRRLEFLGAVGEPFDPSIMECVDEEPIGDAEVTAVVERDGLPQRGLGCPNGVPILYALVEVEEEL